MQKAWTRYATGYSLSMEIFKTSRFLTELEVIVDFIAEDSLSQALLFMDKLDLSVLSLVDTPYRCRASTKSSDIHMRDLVFKGYVIPYRINELKNRIELIGMFSANEWEM